jgi:hypothetical protein
MRLSFIDSDLLYWGALQGKFDYHTRGEHANHYSTDAVDHTMIAVIWLVSLPNYITYKVCMIGRSRMEQRLVGSELG